MPSLRAAPVLTLLLENPFLLLHQTCPHGMGKPKERWYYLDRAELPSDTQAVPIHTRSGMHPYEQEVRTAPLSQLNSLHALSTWDTYKSIFCRFCFFFPPGCFPECMYHYGNAIPLCSGKKEEILGEFGRSSFYPNLTKHFSLPGITHLSTQKLQIWTFEDRFLLPLLALRTFPLITTVKNPCVNCWSHSFTWAEIHFHCRIVITTFELE